MFLVELHGFDKLPEIDGGKHQDCRTLRPQAGQHDHLATPCNAMLPVFLVKLDGSVELSELDCRKHYQDSVRFALASYTPTAH